VILPFRICSEPPCIMFRSVAFVAACFATATAEQAGVGCAGTCTAPNNCYHSQWSAPCSQSQDAASCVASGGCWTQGPCCNSPQNCYHSSWSAPCSQAASTGDCSTSGGVWNPCTPSPMPSPTRRRSPTPSPSGGCVQKSGHQWCSARAVAAAWNAQSGAAGDCAIAMAMALGEGFNTAAGAADSVDIDNTDAFNMDQTPYDGQSTLGPWQVTTANSAATASQRVSEVVSYLRKCCGTAGGCQGCSAPANCPNTVDGGCTNPCFPAGGYPLTTIFASNGGLPWCGCPVSGSATIGFSGRCSQNRNDDYSRYLSAGQRACSGASIGLDSFAEVV